VIIWARRTENDLAHLLCFFFRVLILNSHLLVLSSQLAISYAR